MRTERQQIGMALLRVEQTNLWCVDAWQTQLFPRGHDAGHAVEHTFPFLIHQQTIEVNRIFVVVLGGASDRHIQRVANPYWVAEVQVLL